MRLQLRLVVVALATITWAWRSAAAEDEAADPVRLLAQLGALQEALWRHAVRRTPGAAEPTMRFTLTACGSLATDDAHTEALSVLTRSSYPRKYRRTKKARGPRTYRTRPDPFAEVWATEVEPLLVSSNKVLDVINKVYARTQGDAELGNKDEDEMGGEAEELVDILDLTDEAPIIRWVNSLFLRAMKERASDIHIEPEEKEAIVRYRIDGELYIARRAPRAEPPPRRRPGPASSRRGARRRPRSSSCSGARRLRRG